MAWFEHLEGYREDLDYKLSLAASYVICDAEAVGCPIKYASEGYCSLHNLRREDCIDKKCGDLVGVPAMKARYHTLFESCYPGALDSLQGLIREQVRQMITTGSGSLVTINYARDVGVFPVLVVMRLLRDPLSGRRCAVGLQFRLQEPATFISKVLTAAMQHKHIAHHDANFLLKASDGFLDREDVTRFLRESALTHVGA